jgi:hypothetical protein
MAITSSLALSAPAARRGPRARRRRRRRAAELPQQVDLGDAAFQHHRAVAVGDQDAADHLAQAAEARDDGVRRRLVELAGFRFGRRVLADGEPLVGPASPGGVSAIEIATTDRSAGPPARGLDPRAVRA